MTTKLFLKRCQFKCFHSSPSTPRGTTATCVHSMDDGWKTQSNGRYHEGNHRCCPDCCDCCNAKFGAYKPFDCDDLCELCGTAWRLSAVSIDMCEMVGMVGSLQPRYENLTKEERRQKRREEQRERELNYFSDSGSSTSSWHGCGGNSQANTDLQASSSSCSGGGDSQAAPAPHCQFGEASGHFASDDDDKDEGYKPQAGRNDDKDAEQQIEIRTYVRT